MITLKQKYLYRRIATTLPSTFNTNTQRNRPQFNPMSIMFSIFIFIGRPHSHSTLTDNFDVYNIETALPKIDLEAIENHLKAAKEEERRVSPIYLYFHFIVYKRNIYRDCNSASFFANRNHLMNVILGFEPTFQL